MVMDLSTFYRESLSKGRFYLTIKEELEMTEAYLHILKIRYYNKFDYTITCPERLLNNCCLKLLLQPIVENSIYHGIKELEYNGLLEIVVEETEKIIKMTVMDNGIGLTKELESRIWEKDSSHFGIKNIHQRIQLYYGPEYGLSIYNRPKGGCTTILKIGKQLST